MDDVFLTVLMNHMPFRCTKAMFISSADFVGMKVFGSIIVLSRID